jgi:hypothetical protein
MDDQGSEIKKKRRKILRTVLWVFLPLLVLPQIISNYFLQGDFMTLRVISTLLVLVAYIDVIILYSLSEKFYNWTVVLFLILVTQMVLSRNHLPTIPGNISVLLGFVSIATAIKFLKKFHRNLFLKWFGFFTNIIMAFFMIGFSVFGSMMPVSFVNFCLYTGSLLFIILILALVFTLPNSKYSGWIETDRKIFLRVIITPMIFIFCLICLIFVFNDTFRILMNSNYSSIPWNVGDLQLFNLEGIPKL